jgi:hypothetical protein
MSLVIGKTQTKRQVALTKIDHLQRALFIQGGKSNTHEMILMEYDNSKNHLNSYSKHMEALINVYRKLMLLSKNDKLTGKDFERAF